MLSVAEICETPMGKQDTQEPAGVERDEEGYSLPTEGEYIFFYGI